MTDEMNTPDDDFFEQAYDDTFFAEQVRQLEDEMKERIKANREKAIALRRRTLAAAEETRLIANRLALPMPTVAYPVAPNTSGASNDVPVAIVRPSGTRPDPVQTNGIAGLQADLLVRSLAQARICAMRAKQISEGKRVTEVPALACLNRLKSTTLTDFLQGFEVANYAEAFNALQFQWFPLLCNSQWVDPYSKFAKARVALCLWRAFKADTIFEGSNFRDSCNFYESFTNRVECEDLPAYPLWLAWLKDMRHHWTSTRSLIQNDSEGRFSSGNPVLQRPKTTRCSQSFLAAFPQTDYQLRSINMEGAVPPHYTVDQPPQQWLQAWMPNWVACLSATYEATIQQNLSDDIRGRLVVMAQIMHMAAMVIWTSRLTQDAFVHCLEDIGGRFWSNKFISTLYENRPSVGGRMHDIVNVNQSLNKTQAALLAGASAKELAHQKRAAEATNAIRARITATLKTENARMSFQSAWKRFGPKGAYSVISEGTWNNLSTYLDKLSTGLIHVPGARGNLSGLDIQQMGVSIANTEETHLLDMRIALSNCYLPVVIPQLIGGIEAALAGVGTTMDPTMIAMITAKFGLATFKRLGGVPPPRVVPTTLILPDPVVRKPGPLVRRTISPLNVEAHVDVPVMSNANTTFTPPNVVAQLPPIISAPMSDVHSVDVSFPRAEIPSLFTAENEARTRTSGQANLDEDEEEEEGVDLLQGSEKDLALVSASLAETAKKKVKFTKQPSSVFHSKRSKRT